MNKSDQIVFPLAAAIFLVFFSAYMVAPLMPTLSKEFLVDIQTVGWVIPAYLLSYGISTLFYGPISDRIGRKKVLLSLLFLFIFITLALSVAGSFYALILLRVLSGICAGGILPITLAWLGDAYPYEKLGRPMGWVFGAVAGGTAFGSTVGAWLNPVIGWRYEFAILACAIAVVFVFVWRRREILEGEPGPRRSLKEISHGYFSLLKTTKGRGTFTLVFFNGLFHAGIFSWLGYFLSERYQLSDLGIGTALVGYGLPGMILGPFIGRRADRDGRRFIIPLGFALAALCALMLMGNLPLWSVAIVITVLSVGFDMTHPLMSGIIASLDPKRRGQAMGLNAFAIFTGSGMGAMVFQFLLTQGFTVAYAVFGFCQLGFALYGVRIFWDEVPQAKLLPHTD